MADRGSECRCKGHSLIRSETMASQIGGIGDKKRKKRCHIIGEWPPPECGGLHRTSLDRRHRETLGHWRKFQEFLFSLLSTQFKMSLGDISQQVTECLNTQKKQKNFRGKETQPRDSEVSQGPDGHWPNPPSTSFLEKPVMTTAN